MVRLKRRYLEGKQLSFFDYYDAHKNDIKEEPTKVKEPVDNMKDDNSQFDENGNYKGLSDNDYTQWENKDEFLRDKYKEYNRRFFNNRLPVEFPIYWEAIKNKKTCGITHAKVNLLTNREESYAIGISTKRRFATRYFLENTIIHEMCHVYQSNILGDYNYKVLLEDSKKGSGSYGHGPLFFQAADMVNNSPENKEKFVINQYSDFGESVAISKKIKKASGLFSISVEPNYVSFNVIPESKAQSAYSVTNNLFTYKDADAKSYICNNIKAHGETSLYLNPKGSMLNIKKIKQMIADGELIPIRPVIDEKNNKLYHICVFRSGRGSNYEFLKVSNTDSWKQAVKEDLEEGSQVQYRELIMDELYKDCITLCKNGFSPFFCGFDKEMKLLMPCIVNIGEWKTITKDTLAVSEGRVISEDDMDSNDIDKAESELSDIKNIVDINVINDNIIDIEIA